MKIEARLLGLFIGVLSLLGLYWSWKGALTILIIIYMLGCLVPEE